MAKKNRGSLGALDPASAQAYAVRTGKGAIESALNNMASASVMAEAGKCKTALGHYARAQQERGRYIGLSLMEDAVHRQNYRAAETFDANERQVRDIMAKECLAPWALSGAPKRKLKTGKRRRVGHGTKSSYNTAPKRKSRKSRRKSRR